MYAGHRDRNDRTSDIPPYGTLLTGVEPDNALLITLVDPFLQFFPDFEIG